MCKWQGLNPLQNARDVGQRANLTGSEQATIGATSLANEWAASGSPQLRNVRTPDAKRSAGMQIRTPAIDFKESQSTSLYG